MNPLSDICDDIPEEKEEVANTKDITIDIPVIAEDPPDMIDHERKREDIILQKNMNVVSKAMFGEEIMDNIRAAVAETIPPCAESKEEESENFKEIVETVKNALLSFRIMDEEKLQQPEDGEKFAKCDSGIEVSDASGESSRGDLCDVDLSPSSSSDVSSLGNIPSLKSNSDTTIVSSDSCEMNQRTECDDKERIVSNVSEKQDERAANFEEDSLNEYNSYNYWYIRPAMPVDLAIVTDDTAIQSSVSNESPCVSEKTVGKSLRFSFKRERELNASVAKK